MSPVNVNREAPMTGFPKSFKLLSCILWAFSNPSITIYVLFLKLWFHRGDGSGISVLSDCDSQIASVWGTGSCPVNSLFMNLRSVVDFLICSAFNCLVRVATSKLLTCWTRNPHLNFPDPEIKPKSLHWHTHSLQLCHLGSPWRFTLK